MEDEKGQEETNIKVYVRTRPFSEKEKFEGAQACVQFFEGLEQIKVGAQVYTFDRVFRTKDEQQHVYEKCGVPILTKFLEGYNCTILAYGQTGSGKTFTMGTEETMDGLEKETRGLIPRLVSDLFKAIEESSCPSSYKVAVSMLEIYQDELADLLSSSRDSLSIREQKGTVFVQGLSSSLVKGLHETMVQLGKGCQARAKGSTAMNAQSSRSHAIFTITLQKTSVDENECSFTAKFHLVDLAGSERLKKTQAEGERKKEGIKINEGLLALGNVISSLSDGLKHVPYRDSKITRLLQDSLGGTSYTIMIACISPADTNGEETLSTLRYADRAKRIKNKVILNVDVEGDGTSAQAVLALRNQLCIIKKRHEQELKDMRDGFDKELEETREQIVQLTRKLTEKQNEIENIEFDLKIEAEKATLSPCHSLQKSPSAKRRRRTLYASSDSVRRSTLRVLNFDDLEEMPEYLKNAEEKNNQLVSVDEDRAFEVNQLHQLIEEKNQALKSEKEARQLASERLDELEIRYQQLLKRSDYLTEQFKNESITSKKLSEKLEDAEELVEYYRVQAERSSAAFNKEKENAQKSLDDERLAHRDELKRIMLKHQEDLAAERSRQEHMETMHEKNLQMYRNEMDRMSVTYREKERRMTLDHEQRLGADRDRLQAEIDFHFSEKQKAEKNQREAQEKLQLMEEKFALLQLEHQNELENRERMANEKYEQLKQEMRQIEEKSASQAGHLNQKQKIHEIQRLLNEKKSSQDEVAALRMALSEANTRLKSANLPVVAPPPLKTKRT